MLTTYIDKTSPDQWPNWSCQNFKFWGDKVNIIYIKSDDINSGKKLIQIRVIFLRVTVGYVLKELIHPLILEIPISLHQNS